MNHPFAELIGLAFESVHQGRSLCRIQIHEKLFNPHCVVHGSVMTALADTGMGGALYPLLEEGESCATIELKITYFKPVREGTLECSTQLLHKGSTVAALESEIFCDATLVAKASGTYAIFHPRKHLKINV
ncbi:MAG: PaaI family thioesterase [Deltaproteobacteria bacterium]|jgi:acyl-CoA thioesterase|nr:PaaI family thioesterase [Deltaproteobacteria bacterium]